VARHREGNVLSDYPVNVVLLATDLDAVKDCDMPGLKTVDGIADIGFAWMAWFIDPATNCIGMLQVK
jgi:hypothetical protein